MTTPSRTRRAREYLAQLCLEELGADSTGLPSSFLDDPVGYITSRRDTAARCADIHSSIPQLGSYVDLSGEGECWGDIANLWRQHAKLLTTCIRVLRWGGMP